MARSLPQHLKNQQPWIIARYLEKQARKDKHVHITEK